MSIHKLKIIQVLSNGSINFCYKTCNNLKLVEILEKDSRNFYLNTKMTNHSQTNKKKNSGYKNKYLVIK
jgi:hypothetical protein